jgi:hypothetical protein
VIIPNLSRKISIRNKPEKGAWPELESTPRWKTKVLTSDLASWSFVEEAEVVEVEQKARLGVGAELDVDEVEDECVSSIRRC